MAADGRFRIVLVDAHRAYRNGVARAIEDNPELELLGVAEDHEEAVRLIESRVPDVALVDVHLPGSGGFAISRELLRKGPAIPTRIVLADALVDPPSRIIHNALAVGASGYLAKDAPRAAICEALIAVARGGAWVASDSSLGVVCVRPSASAREVS